MGGLEPQAYQYAKGIAHAVLLTRQNGADVWEWANSKPYFDLAPNGGLTITGLTVFTPEGRVKADFGNWITKDSQGTFRVWRPDSFRAQHKKIRNLVHGRLTTYARYGCRCDPCRTAAATSRRRNRQRANKARRVERLKGDSTLAVHGSVSTYRNWGCRCEACASANSAACATWKHSRRASSDAVPTIPDSR